MSELLEDYGMIGDGETAALVSRDGSIDWLCWPRFDSPACFAALLGDDRHGYWRLRPMGEPIRQTRRYQDETLILENRFATAAAEVAIVDFMPVGFGPSAVLRIVKGLHGRASVEMQLKLRFEYGAMLPWLTADANSIIAELGPHRVILRSSAKISIDGDVVRSSFEVNEGEQVAFALSYHSAAEASQPPIDCERALRKTEQYWRSWIGQFEGEGQWSVAVQRSLLTLKALIYQRTGGIVAAPTTSLPEQPGGGLNWDYRYSWIRDATFTLCAFLNSGYRKEAEAWLAWLVRAIGADPGEMHIMYRIDGARRISEYELAHLPGYRHATPVRIGNAASTQCQLDVFGELLDAFSLARRAGIPPSPRQSRIERALVDHIAEVWREPDQGMWESRGEPRHYVYSKVMCWVGVDRFIRHVGSSLEATSLGIYQTLRRSIHEEICKQGYHGGLGSFVDYFGAQSVDASLLMLPLVGFLPIDDERIASTINRIERELMRGGLVRRYRTNEDPPEGAFLACSLWLVDCWRMQGRRDEAAGLLERVLALANDLGLLSEEYNVTGRHLAGNFPQALSHLSLINTALGFSGSVLQRAGG